MCVHVSRIQSSLCRVWLGLRSQRDRRGYCLVRSDPSGCQRVCAGMRGHWPQTSVRAHRMCANAARLWAGLGTHICDAYPESSLLSMEEISDPKLVLVSCLFRMPNACQRGRELGSLLGPICQRSKWFDPNFRSAAQSGGDSVSRQSVVPQEQTPLLIKNNPVGSAPQWLIRCYEIWREI